MFKRGTVVLIPFPFTDLSSAKLRPALIVSASSSHSEDFTVVFISSVVRQYTSSHLLLKKSDKRFPKTGLKVDSVVHYDKIATLSRKVCLGELGFFEDSLMKKGDKILKQCLGLK